MTRALRLAAALRREAEEIRCLADGPLDPDERARRNRLLDKAEHVATPDVYGQVLAPIADRYYSAAQSLAALRVSEATRATRAWKLARLATLQECGDLLADALGVAAPEWEAMRGLADPAVAS
jgi:hypothetical protein